MGLGCSRCMAAHFETIGQGAGAHGIDVDALIEDINKVICRSRSKQIKLAKRDKLLHRHIFHRIEKMRSYLQATSGDGSLFS